MDGAEKRGMVGRTSRYRERRGGSARLLSAKLRARAVEEPMIENLRREARVDARIRVTVVRGRRMISLETSDVSFKGLFLQTHDPPPLRSLMRLRVELPEREIEAHAMAVHIEGSDDPDDGRTAGVGVQFWGLAGPDRTAWDDFVRELIQRRRAVMKKTSSELAQSPGTSPASSSSASTGRYATSSAAPHANAANAANAAAANAANATNAANAANATSATTRK